MLVVTPNSKEARDWVDENVCTEPWQWICGGFAVDHHYTESLLEDIQVDGFSIGRHGDFEIFHG